MTALEVRARGRVRYFVALLCAVLIGLTGATGSAAVNERDESAFDFETGNAAIEVIFPMTEETTRAAVSPSGADVTLVFRVAALLEAAWFDAVAPYHPTAVGIYSDLGRRPASEAATNKNKNIALLHSTYQVLENLLPAESEQWRKMMTSVGLDPDDDQENTETPVGLGNLAAKHVIEKRLFDGMNQTGTEGGRKYNPRPYADYTGYKPVNTPHRLTNPSRWQPEIVPLGNGAFRAQEFVTPQVAVTEPLSYSDPTQFRSSPPVMSDHTNRRAYKKQADEVLAVSAALTDEQKMKAEFFNDKFLGIGRSAFMGLGAAKGLSLDEFVHRFAAANMVGLDAMIAVWNDKRFYDAVRPFSAIRYLYGNKPVTAWGGPGKGTVDDIPGNQWKSYLATPDHPEYPSGSVAVCAALAQVGRNFGGSNEIEISASFPKGSSNVEPGVTPAQDLEVKWTTWTDFVRDCGDSRVWAGVHFKSSIPAGREIGAAIGDRMSEMVKAHVAGEAAPMD